MWENCIIQQLAGITGHFKNEISASMEWKVKNHPNRVKWSENLYLSLFLMKSSSWKIDQVADKIDQVADRFFIVYSW